ncbi:MAG: DUF3592 domain-containing protein [Nakamurella sp.]
MAANVVPGADAGLPAAAATPLPGALPALIGAAPIGVSADGGPTAAGASSALRPPAAAAAPTEPSRRQFGWRWAARGFALLAIVVTVMMIALAIGMRANDGAIDEHLGTATATVLSISPLRTGVEFVDVTGTTIRPEGGVLYPGLLSVGQQFVVEYSTQNPQIARVAGRTASVGTVMIAATLGVTYLVTVPLAWFCLRRSRLPLLGLRRGPGHTSAPVQPLPGPASRSSATGSAR